MEQRVRRLLERQGVARAGELKDNGLSPGGIASLVRRGALARVGPGLYTLADRDPPQHAALAIAAKRVARGVVCLLSALYFHELTTQLPRETWMAIGEKDWQPAAGDIPLRFARLNSSSLRSGVDKHLIDGVTVPMFNPAKTIADCFKFRNRIGLDVAIEALREGLQQRKCTVDDLFRFGEINRVAGVMRPYIEALA